MYQLFENDKICSYGKKPWIHPLCFTLNQVREYAKAWTEGDLRVFGLRPNKPVNISQCNIPVYMVIKKVSFIKAIITRLRGL